MQGAQPNSSASDESFQFHPIGVVRSPISMQQDGGFRGIVSRIELKPEFKDYLVGLESFSHLNVIFWLSEMNETHGLHRPQGNPDAPIVGMFACR